MTALNQSYGPRYYNRGSIEVWDFIRDQGLSYHLGNAIKYICRYGHKGDYNDQLSDLNKAIHYLSNERDYLQSTRNRENLSRPTCDFSDPAGGRVPEGIQDYQFEIPSGTYPAAESDYGGVQGISGCGSDFISFESAVSTGVLEGGS